MNEALPVVYLARHGETAWSLSGQLTGLTDIRLTERGERDARRLGERLRGPSFAKVLTSPSRIPKARAVEVNGAVRPRRAPTPRGQGIPPHHA